ncbi:hypothetical protein BH11PSE11_BH11PSE11_07430 [soil metagenome]
MKLRTNLSLLAAVALIPVIIFSSVVLDMLLDAHRQAALRGLSETARATSLIIDGEVRGAQATLRALSTSPYLLEGEVEKFYEQARMSTAESGSWIILYEANGRQRLNTRLPLGAALPARPDPKDLEEIIRKGVPSVSNLMWAPSMQRHAVLVDLPVALNDGKQYVLSQAFYTEHFSKAFYDRNIPKTWVTRIFDRNGITIARSHHPEQFVGKQVTAETLKGLQAGEGTVLRHRTLEGIEVYDVFAYSKLAGWGLGIGAPVGELDAAASRAIYLSAAGLLTALAFAILVAMLVGHKLVKTIRAAADSASALGRGRVRPLTTRSRIAEFNELNTAIGHAGELLSAEQSARTAAERERERLFESEQESRKLAEAQNKAKDEFLAMLGHELRNPLSAITSAITVLQIGKGDHAMEDRARGVIQRQSEHLRHIIDDLLDLGRVMTGKILLEKQAVDLAALVKSCMDTVQATGRTREYAVSVNAAPAWVHADVTRLEQIVINLVDNALKYTPSGGRVDIKVGAIGGDAVIEVRDSGVGISSELLPRIFDVFVQGDWSLDRTKGGMGIGLALVRRLVELHDGTVIAESNGSGNGSTFTVRLPLVTPIVGKADLRSTSSAGKKFRILLIEDQDDGREMAVVMLQSFGHEVFSAANGVDGLRIAASALPEVALIDIGLPGMDGYEIARRLRADEKTGKIKLIALTGYGLEEDKRQALAAGFDHHLAKPLSMDALRECLGLTS